MEPVVHARLADPFIQQLLDHILPHALVRLRWSIIVQLTNCFVVPQNASLQASGGSKSVLCVSGWHNARRTSLLPDRSHSTGDGQCTTVMERQSPEQPKETAQSRPRPVVGRTAGGQPLRSASWLTERLPQAAQPELGHKCPHTSSQSI